MRTEAPLLAPIFRSDGQARLIAAVMMGDDEFSIADLADRAGLAYATAHREVDRLLEAGILSERQAGRTRLIRANDHSPLVEPLRQIALVTAGPAVLLSTKLSAIDSITAAFLYGSFAARMSGVKGPPPDDIDVMVVGSPEPARVLEACAAVAEQVRRPVNPTILTPDEFKVSSGFLNSVREQPAVPIVGELPWR